MTLPDTAGAQHNPYDYWGNPERLRKGVTISDSLAQYQPAFVDSLQGVADGFLAQDLVVPEGALIVAQPPTRVWRFGLQNTAEAVRLVVDGQIKLRTGGAKYVAAVAGDNFEDPGGKRSYWGTLVCGTVADTRDPAEYAPVALGAYVHPTNPYTVRWLARTAQDPRAKG